MKAAVLKAGGKGFKVLCLILSAACSPSLGAVEVWFQLNRSGQHDLYNMHKIKSIRSIQTSSDRSLMGNCAQFKLGVHF